MAKNAPVPPIGGPLPLEPASTFRELRNLENRALPMGMTEHDYRTGLPEEVINAIDDLAERLERGPLDVFERVVYHGWARLFRCFCQQCRDIRPASPQAPGG